MNPSLTELLEEFDQKCTGYLYNDDGNWTVEDARAFVTRAYELGVAEGQDKAIYAMDEEAKSHWFDAGKLAERERILKGLPKEASTLPMNGTPALVWDAYREKVLALLEGEKST